MIELITRAHYPFTTSKFGDVGHDLYVDINKQSRFDRLVSKIVGKRAVVIWPFTSKMVGSGIHIALPESTWAYIVARSSTSKKRMFTLGGIIDSGYQGEYHTVLGNFSFLPRIIKQGERYAQVIFLPAVRPDFARVLAFQSKSSRGASGFGSTGR